MKRTIAYIDGSNLYYGVLRNTKDKWLDLVSFVKGLLRDDHEVEMVKYFASRVVDKSEDHHKSERQDKYFDALRNRPDVQIIEGYYREREEWQRATREPCLSCTLTPRPSKVRVSRTIEKLTDVNMATELLTDAYEHRADAFVLVTGDSDLSPAVRVVRYSLRLPVLVFNPQRSISNELRKYSTYYRNLESGCAHGHSLPVSFQTHDGREIHCPLEWQ